jgi:UDP-GlcNAc3NAcA epimerase
VKKILTIVGARPQFIKCAPVSRVLRRQFRELLVHTGQHYDHNMSKVFFERLGIPEPDCNLGIGSDSHGAQTGRMLVEIERVALENRPDGMLVYGDTNSTLAGALVAAKLQIPLAHVEAGLRSFNKKMPEEINRVCADHVASILFCPTEIAVQNLRREGIVDRVFMVGDVMKDALLQNISRVDGEAVRKRFGIGKNEAYAFFTLHRQENTADMGRLMAIFDILSNSAYRIIFPVHPRTRGALTGHHLQLPANITVIDPVDYLESLALQKEAELVVTDSGGIQKEAYILGTPCVTLREETEWVETVQDGWNVLAGIDKTRFLMAEQLFREHSSHSPPKQSRYGSGDASEKIVNHLGSVL